MKKLENVAEKLLGMPYESLDEPAKEVARHMAERTLLETCAKYCERT